jgi:NitT/TauT family transport system permease protein
MSRQQRPTVNSFFPALVFWTAVWYLAARVLDNPLLLPGPVQVLRCLGAMLMTAVFWQTAAVSIGRILLGVICAICMGTLLAVLTTQSRLLHILIAPAMTAMQATPVASFTILVLIWVSRDYVPVLICAMMGLPIVWNSVSGGIRLTDPQLLEMAKVYRLPKLHTLRRIWIPSVMPFFRTACSSALGLGWKAGIAAEVLTVPKHSIGKMIMESKLYILTEELFAWTLAVILFSLLLQKLMQRLLQGREGRA